VVLTVGLAFFFAPTLRGQPGSTELADGSAVVVDPRQWACGELPILDEIDIGGKLRSGSWVLVFYRRGCKACHDELSRFLEAVPAPGEIIGEPRLAFIEIPANGGTDPLSAIPVGCENTQGALVSGPRWFVPSPMFVRLQNGVVRWLTTSADEAVQIVVAQRIFQET